jgi:Receptor family ligand binding region
MAAALMAARHFNERDPSVVPELAGEFYQSNCTYQIDLNPERSKVIDSQLKGQAAGREVMNYIKEKSHGCPMVGPYSDDIAKALSNIAWSVGVPNVLYHALDYDLSNKELYPYTSQTNAMTLELLYPLIQYLNYTGRNNFISVLYEVDGRATALVNEALIRILRGSGMFANRQGFISQDRGGILYEDNTVRAALNNIKQEGNFRTIVVLLDPINAYRTLPQLAEAAEDLAMNTGEHVWVFFGTSLLPFVVKGKLQEDELIVKLLQGAALIDYVDGFMVDGDQDPFFQSWRSQDASMARLLNEMDPVPPGIPSYHFAKDDFFQRYSPVQ